MPSQAPEAPSVTQTAAHIGDPGTRRRGIRQCARQPAGHRAGKRRRPGRCGRRSRGGRRRARPGAGGGGSARDVPARAPPTPAKLGALGTAVGSPQLSASGLAKAELACPQPSSNGGLLERSPRSAPPGRLEDRPLLLRAFGRWRPTIAGLRGTRGFWQGPGRKGMRAPGPPACSRGDVAARETRVRACRRVSFQRDKSRDVRAASSTALG